MHEFSYDEKFISVYGVFARKTIPSRTQFGPVEGLLIKNEADCDDSNVSEDNVLQLTIKFEDGKLWRLDTSNEGEYSFNF